MFKSEKSMKNQQKSTNNQKSEKSKNVSKVNCFVNEWNQDIVVWEEEKLKGGSI